VIHPCVDRFFLFAFVVDDLFGNDLYRAVRTSNFTRLATGAAMFVCFIMRHNYFATETIGHHQRRAVIRVLFGLDLFRVREIITRHLHSFQKRSYRQIDRF
jgi:hypothetical protein